MTVTGAVVRGGRRGGGQVMSDQQVEALGITTKGSARIVKGYSFGPVSLHRNMTQGAIHEELGSVQLAASDFRNLESLIWNHSSPGTLRIVLTSPAGSERFTSYQGIEDAERLREMHLTAYDIDLSTTEGHLSITGNGLSGDYHYLTIEGDEEWVDELRDEILSFYKERENRLRTIFSSDLIEALTIFAAVFLGTVTPRFLPSLMLHIPVTLLDIYYFVILSTIVLSLVFRSKTYPYVKITIGPKKDYQFDIVAVTKYALLSMIIVILLDTIGGIFDPTRSCLILPC